MVVWLAGKTNPPPSCRSTTRPAFRARSALGKSQITSARCAEMIRHVPSRLCSTCRAHLRRPKLLLLNVHRSFETSQVASAQRAEVICDVPSCFCSTCRGHLRRLESPMLKVRRSFEASGIASAQCAEVIGDISSARCPELCADKASRSTRTTSARGKNDATAAQTDRARCEQRRVRRRLAGWSRPVGPSENLLPLLSMPC